MSGTPKTSPPDVDAPAAGGEHHETPIWDAEFADRWHQLRALLEQTVDEKATDG